MIIIDKTLDFKLLKNNNLIIDKNTIAYSKKNDRILFELDDNTFSILIDENQFELEKENDDSIFKIGNNNASIYLKEKDLLFPINIEDYKLNIIDNKYVIKYQLESDDEHTTIEIIL